jgi:antitoxin component YwqK of YwqJK toxin-antitoxin module
MGEPFNILDFPVEIIQHIFFFINDTKGYAAFRQSCKYMYSCTNKVKHFYPSGKVRRHVPIKNGEISGHVISFHQNYLTNYIGLFIKNQREGIHRYFYSDNKLMYTGNYEDNKKKGNHFWYHYNGALERFSHFKNDKKTGKEIAYNTNSSIKWIMNYFDNRLCGINEFYKDTFGNQKCFEIPIIEEKVDGLVVIYNLNGMIKYQGIVRRGYPIGTHKVYYNNGRVKTSIEFKKGRFNGFMKEFYSNGRLKSIVKYKNNQKVSRENTWHNSNKNKLKTTVRYEKNIKNGYYLNYNYFGSLDKKLYFEKDETSGLTEIYTKAGLQLQSYSKHIDIILNYMDGRYSTVFFRDETKNITNLYSYFVNGQMKNKSYCDGRFKVNYHYNIFGELLTETYILNNLVKCNKHTTETSNSDVDDALSLSDRMLVMPI